LELQRKREEEEARKALSKVKFDGMDDPDFAKEVLEGMLKTEMIK